MKHQRMIGAALGVWGTLAGTAWAQVTITASDMFNQPGQYYRAYANTPQVPVDVSGLLGEPGSEAQVWNFISGPREVTYRFDYMAAGDAAHHADFPFATLAERKTDESGSQSEAWLYFQQDPSRGRIVHGFYDASLGGVEVLGIPFKLEPPAGFFQPALRDFPATIRFGDQWTSSTVYTNLLTLDAGGGDGEEDPGGLIEFPQQTTYSATSKVDAFGVISSPGSTLGFGECLRINELVQYDLAVDMGTGYEHFGTAYVRNFYWLRPGRGIVAQVTSEQQQGTPPPDSFPTAAVVLRMFETNHPDGTTPGPEGIQGLTITLSAQGALLSWTKLSGVLSYQVQQTVNPADAASWQSLGASTTANFLIDTTANTPGAPTRYYRVVGQKN